MVTAGGSFVFVFIFGVVDVGGGVVVGVGVGVVFGVVVGVAVVDNDSSFGNSNTSSTQEPFTHRKSVTFTNHRFVASTMLVSVSSVSLNSTVSNLRSLSLLMVNSTSTLQNAKLNSKRKHNPLIILLFSLDIRVLNSQERILYHTGFNTFNTFNTFHPNSPCRQHRSTYNRVAADCMRLLPRMPLM